MKKFLPYILILIVLIELIIPAVRVFAADPTGDCYIYYGHATPPYSETKQGITKTACDGFKSSVGRITATWYQGSTAGAAWRCYDGNGNSTSFNEIDCANKNFSWAFGLIQNPPPANPVTEPTGDCTILDSGGEANVIPGKTKAECDTLLGTWSTTTSTSSTDKTYHFLAPLPDTNGGLQSTFDPTGTGGGNLGGYLNLMIKLFIGICAVLAVIMIVLGGIEYMTSGLISSKEHGKERILGAVFGLLLALGAYLLLYTINPDLLNTNLSSLQTVTVDVVVNDSVPQTYDPITKKYLSGATYGADWATTSGMAQLSLPSWIGVNSGECQKVGDSGCTSLRGLTGQYLNTVHAGCPTCQLTITGGTEFWLHGGATGSTSHGPGSPTVDLRTTPELTNYIKSGTQTSPHRWTKDGVSFLEESDHWHAGR